MLVFGIYILVFSPWVFWDWLDFCFMDLGRARYCGCVASLSSAHIINKWTVADKVSKSNPEQFAVRPAQFCVAPKTAFKSSHYQYATRLFLNCEAVTKLAFKITLPFPAGTLRHTQALNATAKSISTLAFHHGKVSLVQTEMHTKSTQQPADPAQRWSKTKSGEGGVGG